MSMRNESTIGLSHDTPPETAEALVWRNLARGDKHITVNLNGFPAGQFRTIAQRLPATVRVTRLTPNNFGLTVARQGITVWTGNLDWANAQAGDRADLHKLQALGMDAFLGQELSIGGQNLTSLRNVLGQPWHITQAAGGARSQTGVAVSSRFASPDGGYALGLGKVPGVKMHARSIAWRDVQLDGRTVRLASLHMPPARFGWLWPAYAAQVAAFVRTSPAPVVLGGDWNKHLTSAQVRHLAAVTGLRLDGIGIDGFLYSPRLRIVERHQVSEAADRTDHPLVGATFTWA